MKLKQSQLLIVGALSLSVSSVVSLQATQALAAPKKATAAKAEKEGPRLVAVGPVTGPMHFSVRQWLSGALEDAPDQFALVDDGKSKNIAEDSDDKALAGFAKKNKTKAIIVGEVKKTRKGYSLTVKVHGPDGVEMDGVEFEGASAAKLKKSVQSSLITALQGVLGMGAAAPAEAAAPADGSIAPEAVVLEEDENAAKTKKGSGEDEEPASEEAAPAEEESKKPGGLTPLKLEVGGRARSRSFAYTDPLDAFYGSQLAPTTGGPEFPVAPVAPSTTDTTESGARYPLSDYSLVYPGFFIGAEWYPAAHFTTGIPTYFGFVGNYQKDAIATTTAIGEDVISTASFSYFAGLKVRLPLGKHQVAAFGGIGEHAFDVGTEDNDFVDVIPMQGPTVSTVSEITVPSTDYKYLRVGAEGTVNLEPLAITAGVAARLVNAMGEVQDQNWFPFATAKGWDASLKAELPIFELGGGPVALGVGVDFTRYAWAANSSPDDVKYARVAGGGVDNYVSGWLGVSYALGGSGGDVSVKAVAASDEAAPAEEASSSSDEE